MYGHLKHAHRNPVTAPKLTHGSTLYPSTHCNTLQHIFKGHVLHFRGECVRVAVRVYVSSINAPLPRTPPFLLVAFTRARDCGLACMLVSVKS